MSYTNLIVSEPMAGVRLVTLNRPDKLNALNRTTLEEIDAVIRDVESDNDVRVMVFTGAGEKAFCAGADISELAEASDVKSSQAFAQFGQQVFNRIERMGKPSVAAINGFALGGGLELAMATSIRIASEKAKFSQPEIKLGVIPGFGGTQRLSRLIGQGRALDLCLTGRMIDAQTAAEYGLVTQLVSPDTLQDTAISLAENLVALPPVAMQAVIRSIIHGYNLSLDAALQLEADEFALCCTTQDKQEGTAAFLAKRTPVFRGV